MHTLCMCVACATCLCCLRECCLCVCVCMLFACVVCVLIACMCIMLMCCLCDSSACAPTMCMHNMAIPFVLMILFLHYSLAPAIPLTRLSKSYCIYKTPHRRIDILLYLFHSLTSSHRPTLMMILPHLNDDEIKLES